MLIKSKLEELSSNLSEEERRDLLDKINKSMEGSDGEYYVHVELEEDDRKKILNDEITRLGLWKKFLLWFLKTISGHDRSQVFLSMKITELRRSIKRTNPGLTGFETRELSVKFIQCVYDLYSAIYPVRELYQYYVNEASFKERMIFSLVADKYERAKNIIEDFIRIDELEDVFSQENGQQSILNLLGKRFEEYIKSLPGSLFQKIQEEIMPLLSMKNIALFNYKELFQYFDYYLPPSLDKKYPVFRSAPVMIVIDHLERLYYALYYALKNTENSTVINEHVLSVYLLQKLGFTAGQDGQVPEKQRQIINSETAALKNSLLALIAEIMRFYSLIPLLDLIKYFKRDPYFRLKFYIPPLPIKQIYLQSLRKKLKGELDARINEIKDRVIDRKIKELFRDLAMTPFNHYTENAAESFLRIGLPYFTRVKSLMLVNNYIQKVYREFLREVLEIAATYFFTNNKRNENRLLQYASSIEGLADKILWYDNALSPEEDDGKTILRLKYNIASDLTHQKLYKSFLMEKDRDAQDLLDKGVEYFSGFKNIFDEILSTPTENTQTILKKLVMYQNKQYTMGQLFQLLTINIGDFLKLLAQVMDMEKGR